MNELKVINIGLDKGVLILKRDEGDDIPLSDLNNIGYLKKIKGYMNNHKEDLIRIINNDFENIKLVYFEDRSKISNIFNNCILDTSNFGVLKFQLVYEDKIILEQKINIFRLFDEKYKEEDSRFHNFVCYYEFIDQKYPIIFDITNYDGKNRTLNKLKFNINYSDLFIREAYRVLNHNKDISLLSKEAKYVKMTKNENKKEYIFVENDNTKLYNDIHTHISSIENRLDFIEHQISNAETYEFIINDNLDNQTLSELEQEVYDVYINNILFKNVCEINIKGNMMIFFVSYYRGQVYQSAQINIDKKIVDINFTDKDGYKDIEIIMKDKM